MNSSFFFFFFKRLCEICAMTFDFQHTQWCRQRHTGEDTTQTIAHTVVKQLKAEWRSIPHHLISMCCWKWAWTGECSRRGCRCSYQTYAFKGIQSTGRQTGQARTSYSHILSSALQHLCEPTLASNPLLSSAITFRITGCKPGRRPHDGMPG